ncbi:MAG: T9SS type A sorting domain-containing protein [Bacteroidales bacterium]|nr:T9SS type A sorting domain-containing protein [Bacteroidales bacterium]
MKTHTTYFQIGRVCLIILLIGLIAGKSSIAQQPQDYQCFRQDAVYFYHQLESWNPSVVALRLDSSVVTEEGTEWYNHQAIFRYFYDEYDWCFQPDGPSWMGLKLLVKPNGDNLLYGLCDDSGWPYHIIDTLLVKTSAMPGDSWCFIDIGVIFGSDTMATVTRYDTMSFMGFTDSVKVIDFGIDSLILSKNHGLVRTFNFRDFFPYETYDTYELTGITTPDTVIGTGLMTYGEVYDYEIGDIFHRSSEVYSYVIGIMYEIFEVLDKYYSDDQDTVFYEMSSIRWNVGPEGTSEVEYDTVVEAYTDLGAYVAGGHLPTETIWTGDDGFYDMSMYFEESSYFGRKWIDYPYVIYYGYIPPDTCYEPMWSSYTRYIEGLGSYWFSFSDEYYCMPCQYLDYYLKGNEEWGSPYLIPTGINEEEQLPVRIYPVPSNDYLMIEVDPVEFEDHLIIVLSDLSGRILSEKSVLPGQLPYRLDLRELENGVFFLLISSGNKQSVEKIIH